MTSTRAPWARHSGWTLAFSLLLLGTEGFAASGLTLERTVALAIERNERAGMAQEAVEAAQARLKRARAFFFPELSTTGTYTRRLREVTREVGGENVVIQRRNALSAVANVRMALLNPASFPLYAQARWERDAANNEAKEQRRTLAFDAAQAFLATLGAEQVQSASRQRRAFAASSLADAKTRAEAGLASRNDVTRAELEQASAEIEVAQAQGWVQESRLELGYLLVEPVKEALVFPEALAIAALEPPEARVPLAQGALKRRPDLLAQRDRLHALSLFAQEPLYRLLPSLGATAQYRMTNESGLAGRQNDGFITLDLTWNLFDGGERYAERDERLAVARAAALSTHAQERRVTTDLQRAEVALTTARVTAEQGRVAVQVAKQNAEESTVLYREGLTTQLSVADAALRLFEAEVALAQSRYTLGLALLDFRAAAGLGPLGEEP